VIVSNQDKGNVLNKYFTSVYTHEDLRNMPSFPDVFQDLPMADIQMRMSTTSYVI